jgi:hypothetical protein
MQEISVLKERQEATELEMKFPEKKLNSKFVNRVR